MEIEIKHEKCKTCKFFLQHYIKRNSTFVNINCGHCVNSQLNSSRVKKKYELHPNCEFWESNEGKIVERREHIKEVIKHMEEHLNEIAIILKGEADN